MDALPIDNETVINLKELFGLRSGVVVNMLSLVTIFAMNIIVPTFMQSVLGTAPLVASLILFPAILCSCAASPIAGCIYDKHGPGILLPTGFACITVFSILTAVFISTASPVVLALIYIPVICGSALIIGPVQSFALSKLPPEMNPHGVTVMSTGFQIAGCFGSSVFTGVYALVGASAIASGVAAAEAMTDGMLAAGVLVGVFALVGFFLALWIRRVAARPIVDAAPAWSTEAGETAVMPLDSLAAIMKTDVYTVMPSTSVAEAMKLFATKGISGAPVLEGDRMVGIINRSNITSYALKRFGV